MKNFIIIILTILIAACSAGKNTTGDDTVTIYSNQPANGNPLKIEFVKGKGHNHPSFVIWIEDTLGNYIETLFITKAVGTGVFTYGKPEGREWVPTEKRRPSTLPYWSHKRGLQEEDGLYIPGSSNPMPDAVTGATPNGSFNLDTKLNEPINRSLEVLFEINQTWDFNEYWTNNKFPGNEAYKVSCQPSVIYKARINLSDRGNTAVLKPIGHGHYAGETGELNPDLSTLTTALKIAEKITVTVQ